MWRTDSESSEDIRGFFFPREFKNTFILSENCFENSHRSVSNSISIFCFSYLQCNNFSSVLCLFCFIVSSFQFKELFISSRVAMASPYHSSQVFIFCISQLNQSVSLEFDFQFQICSELKPISSNILSISLDWFG